MLLSFQPFLLLVVLRYCQGAYSGLSAAAQAGIEAQLHAQTAGIFAGDGSSLGDVTFQDEMGNGLDGNAQ